MFSGLLLHCRWSPWPPSQTNPRSGHKIASFSHILSTILAAIPWRIVLASFDFYSLIFHVTEAIENHPPNLLLLKTSPKIKMRKNGALALLLVNTENPITLRSSIRIRKLRKNHHHHHLWSIFKILSTKSSITQKKVDISFNTSIIKITTLHKNKTNQPNQKRKTKNSKKGKNLISI